MIHLFMIFITYSFIGWLWETFYCSIKDKHFVYRGFLLGPYCPVYGFGVLAVLLLVPKNAVTTLNLYLNIIVIVTIVEYVTSYLLEKLFNMKLWDYSNVPLNIEGRVAVPVSLFWGVGCLFLIKVIQPWLDKKIVNFIHETNGWGPVIILILFIIDVLSTLTFTFTTKQYVEDQIDTSDKENAGVKEYRLKHLFANKQSSKNRDLLLSHLKNSKLKLGQHNLHRLLKNYPNIKLMKKK